MKEIIAMLERAHSEKFWGQLEVTFRDGEVAVVRRVETIKVKGTENPRQNEHRDSR